MRAYFLIFVLALLKVSLAYPQIYNNDFSIDMYEGANHLRYQRSNEADNHGTSVVIENVDADHAVEFHKTEEIITPEQAIKLAQAAMDTSAAKASEGQKIEVDQANVHLHQADTTTTKTETVIDSAVKKESTDKVVKDETHKATAVAAETKEKPTAETTTKKDDEKATGGISHSISKVEISTARSSSNKQKEEVKELSQATKPSYLFKYGEVLNLINQDKINPLSSKSKKEKSKKLTKTNNGGKSTGFSYVMVNGKEYAGPTTGGAITLPKSAVNNQQQNNNNQQNNFGPTNGFMGVPSPYGHHQQFAGGAPAAFKPGFNPMREGTQSLRSNIRMGGFPGYQGFAQPAPTANGIRMLGFNRPPVPFPAASFRPF